MLSSVTDSSVGVLVVMHAPEVTVELLEVGVVQALVDTVVDEGTADGDILLGIGTLPPGEHSVLVFFFSVSST